MRFRDRDRIFSPARDHRDLYGLPCVRCMDHFGASTVLRACQPGFISRFITCVALRAGKIPHLDGPILRVRFFILYGRTSSARRLSCKLAMGSIRREDDFAALICAGRPKRGFVKAGRFRQPSIALSERSSIFMRQSGKTDGLAARPCSAAKHGFFMLLGLALPEHGRSIFVTVDFEALSLCRC